MTDRDFTRASCVAAVRVSADTPERRRGELSTSLQRLGDFLE